MGITTDKVGHRIGLFGGTFDPIHLGHLLAAEQCREQLKLDEVRFVLAATSPFKLEQRSAEAKHRWEMLNLAILSNPFFRGDDRELTRGGTSFTIDTIREVQAENSESQIVFLMGADSLVDFSKWREPGEICRLAFVAVIARGGRPDPDLSALKPYLPASEQASIGEHLLHMPELEISSTEIRSRVSRGMSIRYQVPAAVAAYIAEHRLYCDNTTPGNCPDETVVF